MLNSEPPSLSLPQGLQRQFAEVERRLWRVETASAVCGAAAGLILSFLALFISDRFWDTPTWLRLMVFLLGAAAAAWAACEWARRWLWHRRDLRALANLVQRKYRRLGDRLLGIVELAGEQRHLANFSPALYEAAIHQVAEEAQKHDFRQSVNNQIAKKAGAIAGGLLVCLVAAFVILPQASGNALRRWLMPLAGIERYTLVQLDGLPRELIVAHGEPFEISGTVHYRSFWEPLRALVHLPSQPDITGPVQAGKIRLQIPGQMENGTLVVDVGDTTARIKILPNYRPALTGLAATVVLPDYLHYPEQTNVVQNGSLLAVEGSRIAFHGQVSRALSGAFLQSDGKNPAPLAIHGDEFSSEPAQPEGLAQFIFSWNDVLGLSNAAPLHLSVQVQKDAPPVPDLPDLPHDSAMLVTDVLGVRVQGRDDFGVRELGLTWDFSVDRPDTESATTEVKSETASPHEKKAEKIFKFSPALFRIPADSMVEVQGFARDYLPDRERSRTGPYRIRVLSAEEHAELLREQLEAELEKMEEVTRLQEKIVASTREAKENTQLPETQKSARLNESKEEQLQNASQMQDMSKDAERTLQEAMKNPIFTEDAIRQWSETARQWQKLSQEKMKDAANALQTAKQNSQSHPEDMAEALRKTEDVLKELQKMQEKTNQHMDELQALTLAKRLRKVGDQEKEMSGELGKNAQDIIGLLPKELPEKFRHFDTTLADGQERQVKEADALQSEISRFFERTQKENYGDVSKEMKDAQTTDELDRLSGMIADNIVMQASGGLDTWSDRFQKWGDKLEPKPDPSGGGGQGKSGEKKKLDLTKQLIALLRLREKEMNLHEQTALLDESKAAPDYKEKAAALAGTQQDMAKGLEQIHSDTPLPSLDPAFEDTAGAMGEARTFLEKPDTGKPTGEAEAKSVNFLTDLVNLINEQAQHPPSQSPPQPSSGDSAEEMAFLTQMMQKAAEAKAMAAQPTAGGNRSGGNTQRTGKSGVGNMQGKNAGARNVSKAAGTMESSPAEFRDALDNYFHGIEQKTKSAEPAKF